ncbi:MAG: ATP-binding protein [Bryobacteraceae bacterium]
MVVIREKAIRDAFYALEGQAAVALIGPRQVGKTTLALDISERLPSVYLDLESEEDRVKLGDAALFLRGYEDRLVILDEIHRVPELFPTLRGLIDQGRRKGHRNGRFLILGSASMDLMQQSSESLAGRITYMEMGPLNVMETHAMQPDPTRLWVRGGFPDSFLADDDQRSLQWRRNFIRTYLERDVPMFGPRVPAQSLEQLWTMLAHNQGGILNASKLAQSLMVSAPTVTRYIDLLVDLLLVRRLQQYHGNSGKRVVKAPKVYIRDSGLVHALLRIPDFEALAGHPVVGTSWEGMVIETLIAAAPERTVVSYYRTAAGAEIDLLLDIPGHGLWAIDVKRGLSPKPQRGFHNAVEDVKPQRQFLVYSGETRFPITEQLEAISLHDLTAVLTKLHV